MKQSHKRLIIFTDKYPLVGPIVWLLSVQYFAAQFIVANSWPFSYSWANNFISDLGATTCGQFYDRVVCSPDHALMNISFILLGTTMALGAGLIYQEFRGENRLSLIGFGLMALAGIGTVLVGAFPENTLGLVHGLGAALALGLGNLGMILLGISLKRVRQSFRVYTIISGTISLIAFALFLINIDFGLGLGAIERLASYPQTIWLILFGLYMSASHVRAKTLNQ